MQPTIAEVLAVLEESIPLSYQEKWDNSGLQVGDISVPCTGVLLAVEATETTVAEAAEKGYNLLITHHPILFHPLSRIGTATYVERTVAMAIKCGVSIYASHTASDNKVSAMNGYLANRLSLTGCVPLVPSQGKLYKLEVMVPSESSDSLKKALFEAGAGQQGDYKDCCYTLKGKGEFLPLEGANPTCGMVGEAFTLEEDRLSLLVREECLSAVLRTLYTVHPYEEPAYDLLPLSRERSDVGSGLVGFLPRPISEEEILQEIAAWKDVACISHSALRHKPIQKVAICSGSGGSFLPDAVKAGCDLLLTGEAKYNHYLDAAGYAGGGILLACIGHYESETVARELFKDIISAGFANFAVELATKETNPVHYFRK